MPRPKKCRSVCRLPQTISFSPEGLSEFKEVVILTVEEYETIRLYGGVSGSADAAAEALAAGKLDFNPNVRCGHHHHGEGHSCGHHSCG